LEVRVIRAVSAGDELTISYTDVLFPPRRRQAKLLSQYGFLCNCTACAGPFQPGVGQAQLWSVNSAYSQRQVLSRVLCMLKFMQNLVFIPITRP
jgi:hypothetical protein